MPIGNAYLPAYHLARVKYPSGMVTVTGTNYTTTPIGGVAGVQATPPSLETTDVVYTRYAVRSEQTASPTELIQAWPEAKIFDMGTITHIHEIELPVILVPSNTGGSTFRIRLNEIKFWLSWLTYMFSTIDRANWINPDTVAAFPEAKAWSAVVESANISAGVDGLKLGLSIRTNAPMDWTLELASGKVVGRPANGQDTFVKYETHGAGSPGTYSGVGLGDYWGVTELGMEAKTSTETIAHTPYHDGSNVLWTPWLTADQINAKMVSFTGRLNAFGMVTSRKQGAGNISAQYARQFSVGTTNTSYFEDPFPTSSVVPHVTVPAVSGGGIQIYVGAKIADAGIQAQAMFLLPTGTLISQAGITASGNAPVSVSRQWSGVITDTPRNQTGATGLRAKIASS